MTGTVKTAIEPERELVEIGLKVRRANALVATSQPAFQITEDQMGDRQKVLGHAGITLRRDRLMPIASIAQRRIAAPGVGHHHGTGLDRRLDKAAQRSCRTIRHNFHPNTAGISAVAARHAFDILGLALADFDSRDNEALIMDAPALAARPAADP